MLWKMASEQEDSENLNLIHNAISMYCDIPKEDAMRLNDKSIKAIAEGVKLGFISITQYFNEAVKSGGLPLSIECSVTPYWEIYAIEAEIGEHAKV